jgi:arginyl-tRNA synthetase
MDIRTFLSDRLLTAASSAFPDEKLTEADIVIEKPKNRNFGDFSTPLAMSLAKKVRQAPPAIAARLVERFAWDEAYVCPPAKDTIMGGFINFRLSTPYLLSVLRQITADPEAYGKNQVSRPKRLLFEFVSANPTGPMVVVNARAAAIGDVVARVNEWIGHSVEREFYVNDYGNQVALLGKSAACRYRQKHGRACEIPEGGYEGAYIADLAEEIAAECPEVAAMSDEQAEALFREKALEKNIASQQVILRAYGVEYTRWFRESSLHGSGAVKKIGDYLSGKGLTYEKDGALWFKATEFGDEKDWVIYRSDGTPTYFLADIAYHADKASRGYDESHTFWGPDHHGYIPHLECSVKALAITKTAFRNHIIQQVNLIRDGQPFKMSKRKGDFITMTDLLDEVGRDAARYFFLMRKLSSHFDFDMNLAVKKSDDNPVFYVQYAHARTCNVIKHAYQRDFSDDQIAGASLEQLTQPEETECIKLLAEFPTILYQVAVWTEPQRITAYLEGLAAQYHQFYQKHRIVTEDRPTSLDRLRLTLAVRNVLRVGLEILGVSAPESM